MPAAASNRARNNATAKKIHQKWRLSYCLGSMSRIRVSIVEDNAVERREFAAFVTRSANLVCASVHATLSDACAELAAHHPDVVLLDLKFEGEGPAHQRLTEMKARLPAARFLMFTRFHEDEDVFPCLLSGASGYLVKSEPDEKLIEAITEVHAGRAFMSSVIARKVLDYLCRSSGQPPALAQLSPREGEILRSLATGQSYKEIAENLRISYHTVRAHIREIYEKLHVHSRGEAVAKLHQGR